MSIRLPAILFGAALLLRAPCSLAQERHPCTEDARRLCPGPDTSSKRYHCLERNASLLSGACREAMVRMRAAGDAFKADCQGDSSKICPGREGHDLLKCLEKEPAALSAACARRVETIKAARRVTRERIAAACKEDVGALCAGVLPGEGRIRRCLQRQDARLRDACRQELAEPHDTDAVPPPGK